MSVMESQRILDLRKELTEHAFRYYVLSNPTIPDEEYDAKFKELIELEKAHPELNDPTSPTVRVGSPVPTGMRKVKHKVRMLSLDNMNSMDDVMRTFGKHEGQEVTLEMKIDGLSLHLRYKKGELIQAVTRGDGSEGEDVTENARTVRTLPVRLLKPVDIEVRGEVYWSLSAFNRYNDTRDEAERYKNPRNGASGLMRQHDSRVTAQARLDFVAYSIPSDVPEGVGTQEGLLEYLEMLGFCTTTTLRVTRDMSGLPFLTSTIDREELRTCIEFLDQYRKALDLDTDGLVIKMSSLEMQRDLGEGTRTPLWAAAYKFPPEIKEARLLGVIVQVGKTGQVTPVAQIEPTSINGAVIQRASLCNQMELDRLGIDIGDYVKVQRSGETIPKIVGLARPSPTKINVNKSYQLPKTCPCCSSPLIREEGMVHQYCHNGDCHDQIFAKLVYATGKDALDIDGCGESTVELLIQKGGVKTLSDLYSLQDFSFLKPATRKKIIQGLEKAKTAPLWRKLSALNIDDVGKVSCQNLAVAYDNITEISYKALRILDGQDENMDSERDAAIRRKPEIKDVINEQPAKNVGDFLLNNQDEIIRLKDHGFYFVEDRKSAGPLSGKSFVITGKLMSGSRDDVSAFIESKGGVVKGTVTKNVHFVIQGLGGGNNKAAGAAKWGTRIISEEELFQMIGEPMPALVGRGSLGEEVV